MHSLAAFLLVIVLALAILPAPRVQEKSPPEKKNECGTVVSTQQLQVELARKAELARTTGAAPALLPPTDAPYYLPMTIHLVHRSDGTGGLTLDLLKNAMQDLNQRWLQVGVQFFIYGEIDHINNDTYFKVPNDQASQDALRQINVVANTINVYFTNLVDICGQANFTANAAQGVLLDINCMGAGYYLMVDLAAFAHEVGHYFDLYHTHETWPDSNGNPTKVECPSGSNCSTAGDFLCDTPADPNLHSQYSCVYDNSDPTPPKCDNTPYNPPVNNLMSYSWRNCRDEFTPNQISKILQVLTHSGKRTGLITNGTRYVDPLANSSNNQCTYDYPCDGVEKAIQAARDGYLIFIKPGANQASFLGGKRVTLKRWGNAGVAEIAP